MTAGNQPARDTPSGSFIRGPFRSASTSDGSLYDRLGGEAGIDAVVDEFYDRVLDDEDLAPYFEGVDTAALRDHQKEFVASVAGGSDAYDGPSMQVAHEGLGITERAFGRVAQNLDESLDHCGVDDGDREELMTAAATLQDDVVSV